MDKKHKKRPLGKSVVDVQFFRGGVSIIVSKAIIDKQRGPVQVTSVSNIFAPRGAIIKAMKRALP